MVSLRPSLRFPRICVWSISALALWQGGPWALATTEWQFHKTADGLHPSGQEQQMVWLMNRARSNPTAEGEFLAKTGDEGIEFGIAALGVNVAQMKREFTAIAPKPPAAFDRRLYDASYAHSLDLIRRNAQDHNGQLTRITNSGFTYTNPYFSAFSYAENPVHCHGALNIDWGGSDGGMQAGRAHRVAIMSNTTNNILLTNVGLALVPEANPATVVGPLVFSGCWVGAAPTVPDHYNRFLVGTVWHDANTNGLYDPDEGLAGVTVQPDQGAWHAVTGAAGGWSIPVTSPGTFLVRFSGRTVGAPFNRSVTVGNESALLDTPVVPGPGPTTELALGIRPSGGNTVVLEWSGGTPPYRLQRTNSLTRGEWTDLIGSTLETSHSISLSGRSEFFRVLAAP